MSLAEVAGAFSAGDSGNAGADEGGGGGGNASSRLSLVKVGGAIGGAVGVTGVNGILVGIGLKGSPCLPRGVEKAPMGVGLANSGGGLANGGLATGGGLAAMPKSAMTEPAVPLGVAASEPRSFFFFTRFRGAWSKWQNLQS